jgi:hypothetical protein
MKRISQVCLRVLESLEAIYRIQPSRRLKPDMSHLRSPGLQNLITRYGPLDVLGTIGRGLTYEDLLPHTVEMKIAAGVYVKVLDLPTIIAIKEELKGEKGRRCPIDTPAQARRKESGGIEAIAFA